MPKSLAGGRGSAIGACPRDLAFVGEFVDCLAEGIVVQADDGSVLWVNEPARRLLRLADTDIASYAFPDQSWKLIREDGSDFPCLDYPTTIAMERREACRDVVVGIVFGDGSRTWLKVSAYHFADTERVMTAFVDVTYQVTRRLQLEEVHSRERAVLDGTNLSIIGTYLTGLIHTFNRGAERLLGYDANEMVGKMTPSQFHDTEETVARAGELGIEPGFEVFVHAAWQGRSETREWTYIRKDGKRVPVSLTVTPMRDPGGKIVGFMGIAEDITERRKFMLELQKLALVASRTHNLVIVTDAEVRAEWVNDGFTRVTGYTLEEVKGRRIGPMVQGPETDPLVVAKMRAAIAAGEGFQVEVLNYGKNGRKYWLEIDCRPYHGTDGKLLGYIAVESEITARKVMVSQLRESEARLRAFLAAMPDTVFRVSHDGHFLDVHAPRDDFGAFPFDFYLGRSLSEALPPGLATIMGEALETARRKGVTQTFEYQMEGGGCVRDFEARVVAGLGTEMLVILRDVSERRVLDLMKDEFISTVSHELRTPLTAIQGTLGLLSAGVLGQLGKEARELVDASLGNAERLGRLINDILDLDKAKHSGLKLRVFAQPLAPLIERAVIETAVFAAEFDVSFQVGELSRAAKAVVDPDRLLQILQNLLSNASKYGNSHDVVHVGLESRGDSWRIFVKNRGVPIPESFRSRIFDRFAMVDGTDVRARRGTGLGLAITKTLVERMGGRIEYHSAADYTEFAVLFPCA